VPAEQAVNLRIKEKEVRELLLHLAREQAEGRPQALHQERAGPEVGAVPLMVPHFLQKRGEGEDLPEEEGLHLGEQAVAEKAHSSLLQFPREELGVEVNHLNPRLSPRVHLRKKEPEEDRLVGEVLLPKVPVELAIHLYLPQYSPTLHQKTGGAGDPRRQAREHLALQGLLELPKLEVKEQEFLPSLRLPQLGEVGLRLAPRLGLNFLRWGEGKEQAILFQLVLPWE
jgi:hypothetical protein